MVHISSYVFFDLETTGLPWQERNRTKITELCFIATVREDLQKSTGYIPPVSKLTMLLNPQRKINPIVSTMTGLTNEFLKHAPTFQQVSSSVIHFLKDLPRPVCCVAHNGNTFDYKIFLAECVDARINLPDDIYCIDSLAIFRKILKQPALKSVPDDIKEDLWPELNVTPEEWDELDMLCSPLQTSLKMEDISLNITDDEDSDLDEKLLQEHLKLGKNKTEAIKQLFNKNTPKSKVETKNTRPHGTNLKQNSGCNKGEFTLSGLYERLLNKKFNDAHRAENDCFALLECVIAKKSEFLPVADESCIKLSDIKPLQRY